MNDRIDEATLVVADLIDKGVKALSEKGFDTNSGTAAVVALLEAGLVSSPRDERDLSITTAVDTNYGDHGERVQQSHRYIPGEKIEDLVQRVLPKLGGKWTQHSFTDEILIRVIDTRVMQPGSTLVESDPWAEVPASDETPF